MKKTELMRLLCDGSISMGELGFKCCHSKLYFAKTEDKVRKRLLVIFRYPTTSGGSFFTIQLAISHAEIDRILFSALGLKSTNNFCIRFPLHLLDPKISVERASKYFHISLSSLDQDLTEFDNKIYHFALPFYRNLTSLVSIYEFCRNTETERLISHYRSLNLIIIASLLRRKSEYETHIDDARRVYGDAPRLLSEINKVVDYLELAEEDWGGIRGQVE